MLQIALDNRELKSPTMPIRYFRPEIQSIIKEISKIYGMPIEYVVGATLASAGAMLGDKISINDTKHINNPRIWIAIIGSSGLGKSDALAILLQPLIDADTLYEEKFKEEETEWKANGCKGNPPLLRQLYTTQTTWESFTEILSQNPSIIYIQMS